MSSVVPKLDIFNLPVFADANIWSMWPTDKLNELAEDIKDNGFDHRYPITIAEVNGEWMLLDGRNRREAAKIAGIVPPVIVTDVDPKLAVHRSNNQNRDATPGQKAMAFAMAWPDATNKGGRGKTSILEIEVSKPQITRARYVLRNNPVPEGQQYPQRCLDIMAGSLSLTEAYELTQADVKKREEEARIRAENAEKLNDVRARYPNLAALVDDERLSLAQAIASAEQSDREARELAEQEAREKAEKERREREAEEARMAEEERTKREAERQAKEDRENRLVGFFHQLNQLISGTSVVANDAQVQQLDQYKGEWDRFSQTYHHQRRDVIRSLTALRNNLPVLITKLEAM